MSAALSASTKAPFPARRRRRPVSGTSDSYIGGITGINLGLVTGSSTDPAIGGSGGNNFIGGIAGLNVGRSTTATVRSTLAGGTPNYTGGVAGVNAAYAGTQANDPEFELPDRHDHQFERDRQRLHQPGRHVLACLDSRPALVACRLHRRRLHRPDRRLVAARHDAWKSWKSRYHFGKYHFHLISRLRSSPSPSITPRPTSRRRWSIRQR